MEDQLGALRLVINVLRLWSTRYVQQALEQCQATEEVLIPNNVVRLSPLLHKLVNMLGRCNFILPEVIVAEQLRSLRTLTNWEASLNELA